MGFSATSLLQLHSTLSLMLILFLMKSHHIGDSTIFSISSSIQYQFNMDKMSIMEEVEVQLQQQSAPKIAYSLFTVLL